MVCPVLARLLRATAVFGGTRMLPRRSRGRRYWRWHSVQRQLLRTDHCGWLSPVVMEARGTDGVRLRQVVIKVNAAEQGPLRIANQRRRRFTDVVHAIPTLGRYDQHSESAC
jgi:hypothetical protein